MLPWLLAAQEISGGWYGRADVLVEGSHSNYLAELNIRQKGKEVEGVMGYYFRNTYQSFIVRGKYDPKTRTVTIPEVPVAYFNGSMSMPIVHCMMEFSAQLSVSRLKSTLKGLLLSDAKYRYTCPNIDVRLTRDDLENTDSMLQAMAPSNRIWMPSADEMVVTPAVIREQKETPADSIITRAFASRQAFLIREIDVYSDSVRVSIYDNGDVDGDTVSVFYNKTPILVNQGLNTQGVNLYLTLDSTTDLHELSLYAENMGTVPPNTALMIIHDGIHRHEVYSTSNENLNGTVRIRRIRKAVARN